MSRSVLVVGGGVAGLATAVALAGRGHVVQVLERERPGSRASWVAGGLLTPSSPWKYPPALIDLCRRSELLYQDFVDGLRRHTGIDPEMDRQGMLYPEGRGAGAASLSEQLARRRALGFAVEHLDRAALDARQPGLGPSLTGAGWQPDSARVRPPRLLRALIRRAAQLDVHIQGDCPVEGLLLRGGRCVGARLAGGRQLEADVTVLAAGAWSGLLGRGAGVSLDVRPVRGQILLLAGPPGLLGPTLNDGDCYIVPRRDGRLVVGSTMEDAGFDAVTTEAGLSRLRELAAELLPASAELPAETSWAGLRPGTPDRLPFLGPVDEVPGLLLATGHYRNGILLAPLTAALIADLVDERAPAIDLSPFAPRAVDPARPLEIG